MSDRGFTTIAFRARADIKALQPYMSARSEIEAGAVDIMLDANECSHDPVPGTCGYNRYTDQQPAEMMQALARLYDTSTRNIMAARGADEAIDILIRTFCESGRDNIVICPPTFPMYAHSARLQGAGVVEVPLKQPGFQLDVPGILDFVDENTKLVFVCTPNNPTANLMAESDILALAEALADRAAVVVDETYIEFTGQPSLTRRLEDYPNLVILRTLSKACASAGVRMGCAIAHSEVIALLRRVLPIYPVPVPVVESVTRILRPENTARLEALRTEIIATRDWFAGELAKQPGIREVLPADANFLLARVDDPEAVYNRLLGQGIVIRNVAKYPGLESHVRFGIGTRDEMADVLRVLGGQDRLTLPSAGARRATATRTTRETAITARVDLDRPAPVKISTGLGFYDHMLEQIAKHGGFSLTLECSGDLHIDPHHTVEDCAITLGQALDKALGSRGGVERYGADGDPLQACVPMDESLAACALDLSGRPYLKFEADFPDPSVGELPVDMVEHVFRSLTDHMRATCHITVKGDNTHHMVEACFKAFARALKGAIARTGWGEETPSSKGVL